MPKHASHATLERERTLSRIVADDEPVSPAALEECFGVLPLGDAAFEMLDIVGVSDADELDLDVADLVEVGRTAAMQATQELAAAANSAAEAARLEQAALKEKARQEKAAAKAPRLEKAAAKAAAKAEERGGEGAAGGGELTDRPGHGGGQGGEAGGAGGGVGAEGGGGGVGQGGEGDGAGVRRWREKAPLHLRQVQRCGPASRGPHGVTSGVPALRRTLISASVVFVSV